MRKAKQARSSLSSEWDEYSVEIPKTKVLSDRLYAWLEQRERGIEQNAELTLLMREHSKVEIMNQKVQTVIEIIEMEDDVES